MKLINNSNNTIYVEDCDFHIPYNNREAFCIDPDLLRKSRGIRTAIISPSIEIIEFDQKEQIEVSIVYAKKLLAAKTENQKKDFDLECHSKNNSSNEIEVKLQGLFYDASGYGKVNRNIAKKLSEMGVKVQISPKMGRNQLTEPEIRSISHLENTPIGKDYILIDSIIPSFADFSNAKYKILYTTIESYTIPRQFIQSCKYYDEIWLTSPWSANILKTHVKDKPIYSIPSGVDPVLYSENGLKYDFGSNIKDFVFISVFSWNYRKGWDVLVKAYLDEFSSDDNVSLMLMTRYQSGKSSVEREKPKNDINEIFKMFPNKDIPHIVRYGKVVREEDMPKMYRSANAFILTTRGEGSCLPPLEASLCGLPVIMTNCSGQQMYLRQDNSYMIEIDKIEPVKKGQMHIHYWDNQEFPLLTSQEVHNRTKMAMRTVFENYKEAKNKNKNLQKMILDNFTWDHAASAIVQRLKEIQKQLKGD